MGLLVQSSLTVMMLLKGQRICLNNLDACSCRHHGVLMSVKSGQGYALSWQSLICMWL